METTELYSKRLIKGSRTYFFDIKKSSQDILYLTISESKKTKEGFENHKVIVFEENVTEFKNEFLDCLNHFNKLKKFQDPNTKTFTYIREKYPNAYMPWTPEDDEKLEFLFCKGKKVKELALLFDRKKGAIESRIKKMGLKEKYQI